MLTDSDSDQGRSPSTINDDEIDLRELFQVLWRGKWLIGLIVSSGAIVSIVFSLMLTNVYQAEAVLAPQQSDGSGGLAGLAGQYGGLASLAGIDLGGKAKSSIGEGLKILESRKFISGFIERHDILVPLMAAKDWDQDARQLEIEQSIYDVSSKEWVRKVRPPMRKIPSFQEAYRAFTGGVFSVSQDKKTGFVTIAIQHYSPDTARDWVTWLVEDINATVMAQDIRESEQAVIFLKQQVEATTLADLRQVFFRLIEEQTKTLMLAKMSDEYLLKTLDPAVVPEMKVGPKRAIIVMLSTTASGILAILIVLFMSSRKDS
jgi:LPS O-antigen subunit length determinant protein (WzzB/FepE family)